MKQHTAKFQYEISEEDLQNVIGGAINSTMVKDGLVQAAIFTVGSQAVSLVMQKAEDAYKAYANKSMAQNSGIPSSQK